jgi:bifunctional DNA-binding transcriptional regulator/antitoxin component of YhaV-PrlF toxin-antitoxin module
MDELFRLRIATKRQVTIPQRLMDLLGLSVDDELWVEVNGNDVRLVPMVQVPRSMVTPEFLKMLDAREEESRLHPFPTVADGSTVVAQAKKIVEAHDRLHGRTQSSRVQSRAIKDHGLQGAVAPRTIKNSESAAKA